MDCLCYFWATSFVVLYSLAWIPAFAGMTTMLIEREAEFCVDSRLRGNDRGGYGNDRVVRGGRVVRE